MDDLQMLCAGAGDSFAVHFAAFKVCKYCGKELSPSNFFKSGCQSLTARCKQCHGLGQRTCRICGRSFIGKTGQIFCSEACRKTHRPQTFKSCAHCENIFGPVSHLSTRYCSVACKILASAKHCQCLVSPQPIRRELLTLRLHGQLKPREFSAPKPAANVVCKGELRLHTTITMNRSRFAGFVVHAMLNGTGRCLKGGRWRACTPRI